MSRSYRLSAHHGHTLFIFMFNASAAELVFVSGETAPLTLSDCFTVRREVDISCVFMCVFVVFFFCPAFAITH